jgi:hypothetical protein
MVGPGDHRLFALLDYLTVRAGADPKSRDGGVRGRDRFKLGLVTVTLGAFRSFAAIKIL